MQRSSSPDTASDTEGVDFFRDVLNQELHVDVQKLKEVARDGIPPSYRPQCYPLLLGVTSATNPHEVRLRQRREFESLLSSADPFRARRPVTSLLGRWPAGMDAGLRDRLQWLLADARGAPCAGDTHVSFGDTTSPAEVKAAQQLAAIEAVIKTHRCICIHSAAEELEGAIAMVLVLSTATHGPQDAFFCCDALHQRLRAPGQPLQSPDSLRDAVGVLLMLLRNLNPQLCSHLQLEGVSPFAWAPRVFTGMLAGVLPAPDVLALWDHYLAYEDLELHPYAVMALLDHATEDLLELDGVEATATLRRIPPSDIATVISDAHAMRQRARELGLVAPRGKKTKAHDAAPPAQP